MSFDSEESHKENEKEFYLVRVPKNINIQQLNGASIDLNSNTGGIVFDDDNTTNYGYDLVTPQNGTFHHLTRLSVSKDNVQIDPTYKLRGCINIFKSYQIPDNELIPIVPAYPNDPIEHIIDKNRISAIKRVADSKNQSKKKKKMKKQQNV